MRSEAEKMLLQQNLTGNKSYDGILKKFDNYLFYSEAECYIWEVSVQEFKYPDNQSTILSQGYTL